MAAVTAVAVFVVLIAVVAVLPRALVEATLSEQDLRALGPTERLKAENDLRTTLLQALAGIALLAGAVATWRQLNLGRRELRATERGQVIERFGRAVEQLGHQAVDVRIGGVYALEQIAATSAADRRAVIEILLTYVRTRALREPTIDVDPPPPQPPPLRVRAPDVQAALSALTRMPRERDDPPIVLDGADLRGAFLAGADLAGIWLQHADLSFANLSKSDLRGAHLSYTRFHGSNLLGADLRGAALWCADLREAGFQVLVVGDDGAEDDAEDTASRLRVAARLERARADTVTRWPSGFDPEAEGVEVAGKTNSGDGADESGGDDDAKEDNHVVIYRFAGEQPPA